MQASKTANVGLLDRVFKLSENNTNVKTEIIAGITTFMTMAYILVVNSNILQMQVWIKVQHLLLQQ